MYDYGYFIRNCQRHFSTVRIHVRIVKMIQSYKIQNTAVYILRQEMLYHDIFIFRFSHIIFLDLYMNIIVIVYLLLQLPWWTKKINVS